MRQSQTAVLERNTEWSGPFVVEPYETAWAAEALYFCRVLHADGLEVSIPARVQISPDGIHWCDEGSELQIDPGGRLTYCRVTHFGGWLRAVGQLPDGATLRVLIYLVLKE